MSYWSVVAKRAWATARKAAKIDTAAAITVLIFAQIGIALLLSYATGDAGLPARFASAFIPFLLLPLLFAYYFVATIPLLYDEAAETHKRSISTHEAEKKALSEQLSATRTELERLRNPPPPARDPDALYQHGRSVATASNVSKSLHMGVIHIGNITSAKGDFNMREEFEYQDFRLRIESTDGAGSFQYGALLSITVDRAICRILGRT